MQIVLIASFSLLAAITVGLGSIATSWVIDDYLTSAENERVARDMELADAFYQLKLDEVEAICYRMVRDYRVIQSMQAAAQGQIDATRVIDQQIIHKLTVPNLGGVHFMIVFDDEGEVLANRVLWADGEFSPLIPQGNWGQLPIVGTVLSSGKGQTATEIIPNEFLTQVGLDVQARIALKDTPKAAIEPFDLREGSAGLALTSVYPVQDENEKVIGAVLVAHMFNNEYTLVDVIKEVAGVDTVTIFFGDMRVSTNVMTEDGNRAVGTRVSQEVFDVVLTQNQEFVGPAYVVNDWYITRYRPLHDHRGQVVGSLYVGALRATFNRLVDNFRNQVVLIALVCIGLAGIIAVPIAKVVTNPIKNLVEANRCLSQGDMAVRVQTYGNGELAMLGQSFNKMIAKLQQTQQELLHKEKLASMGQLAAGVAHEINNPLGTILLFSDVIHKEMAEGDPLRDDLQRIMDETVRCKRIVADLLNFSRQQEVITQKIDLHHLLDQVVEGVIYQPRFEGVKIVRQFVPDLIIIQADPTQLQQVFTNLLNNAAEAMNGDGTITIDTRLVDKKWVEIGISDEGCGIHEEHMDKLFTPFFTTKPQGIGTGLGLSIAYGIIKMHKGKITVQSEVNEGTTFTITLPAPHPSSSNSPVLET